MYKLALSISLILAPLWLVAQTAEDYFHGGAQYYIWGEKAKATNEVYTGLQKFPTDPLLNGLAQLLKKEEEKQQQQQNQQNQDKKDQDKKDQQNKDQENKQDQSQNKQDQNKDSQQQKEQQQKEQAKKDQSQKQSAEQKNKEEQQAQKSSGKPDENDKQEGQPAYAAGQMTPQQAQQLLDAQKGHEMMLPIKPVGKPRDPSKPLKDW